MNNDELMEEVIQILRVFVLVGIVVVMYGLISLGINNEIDIFNAESELVIQRIIYDQDGISFYDSELKRAYPGIIDSKKFNNNHLETIFSLPKDDQHLAVNLSLKLEDGESKSVSLNGKWFERWYPLRDRSGKGGKRWKQEAFPVTYFDQDKDEKIAGMLTVEVIIPND